MTCDPEIVRPPCMQSAAFGRETLGPGVNHKSYFLRSSATRAGPIVLHLGKSGSAAVAPIGLGSHVVSFLHYAILHHR